MKIQNNYMFWWGVVVADAILYGIISSYIGEDNFIIDIWAVLRYAILFISAIGIEIECEKIKVNLRLKIMLGFTFACALVVLLLGYFISTLTFLSFNFFLFFICLVGVSILGGRLLFLIFKLSNPRDEIIKQLNGDKENQLLEQILKTGDPNKVNLVKSLACLGGAIFTLIIVYLVIPIFIKNSNINLSVLYELGFAFFALFMFFNFKKYKLISNRFNKVQYFIETSGALIGTVLMYYVDGIVYRKMSTTNFILSFVYVLCLIPFLISTKTISIKFYQMMNEMDK